MKSIIKGGVNVRTCCLVTRSTQYVSRGVSTTSIKKTTQLKNLLRSPNLSVLMEAHSAASAKIAQEEGFKGIWASGLTISAEMGLRDCNEASTTQILDKLELMSDRTAIPILLDGDTGYGNYNNARRLVKKLEQRHIAGVCLEDKLFPKTNSLLSGVAQPLAPVDEFCLKIKACKDIQLCPDFQVVARVEAFIAGWGLEEALKRAEAYRMAGADAILIHSKQSKPVEIEAFLKEWNRRHPIIIVPTTYYKTPFSKFRDWGVNAVIAANHSYRASIKAMREICKRIHDEQSLETVETRVAPVDEVFRLQNMDELMKADDKYLPKM